MSPPPEVNLHFSILYDLPLPPGFLVPLANGPETLANILFPRFLYVSTTAAKRRYNPVAYLLEFLL